MRHKIMTSTSAIGNFVYHGTYETYLGEYLGGVPRAQYDNATDDIGRLAVEIITDAFNDIFPDRLSDDFALTYEGTYHPRYYNFETDSVNFTFEYTDDLKDFLFKYVYENDSFKLFLADRYTSYDGFISFTPNKWSEWLEGWNNNEWKCVSALLRFVIEQEITESEIEHLWHWFNEDACTIIEENYTPYEYAEKFDNGFIGVVRSEWSNKEDCTVYTAYLLDKNGNVVNQVKVSDEYNENFHMSAYAAWAYSDIENNLTNNHTVCGIHSEPCEVPEF